MFSKDKPLKKATEGISFPGIKATPHYTVPHFDPHKIKSAFQRMGILAGTNLKPHSDRPGITVAAGGKSPYKPIPPKERFFTGGVMPGKAKTPTEREVGRGRVEQAYKEGGPKAAKKEYYDFFGDDIGSKKHEELHGLFQRVNDLYGKVARRKVATHLVNKIPPEHRKVIESWWDEHPWGGIKNTPAHQKHEEMIAHVTSYLNSPKRRATEKVASMVYSNKTDHKKLHHSMKQAIGAMRMAGKKIKPSHLK